MFAESLGTLRTPHGIPRGPRDPDPSPPPREPHLWEPHGPPGTPNGAPMKLARDPEETPQAPQRAPRGPKGPQGFLWDLADVTVLFTCFNVFGYSLAIQYAQHHKNTGSVWKHTYYVGWLKAHCRTPINGDQGESIDLIVLVTSDQGDQPYCPSITTILVARSKVVQVIYVIGLVVLAGPTS